MYKPKTDKWHDKDSNPMDVDTPKRLSEPAEGTAVVDPQWQEELNRGNRIELDPAAIQNLAQSIMNQKSYLQ